MTLRARMALALAGLAGLAAVLVGVTTYVTTEQRVRAEVDSSLSSQAEALEDPDGRWGDDDPAPRRFDEQGVLELLRAHGLTPVDSHGVRIFSDLVPSALVDSEADRAALLALEDAASRHPDHGALLGALGSVRHVLATRD